MNQYILFGIINLYAITSLVGLVSIHFPALAQENMTMNTSIDAPVENTTEISDTGVGLDGYVMKGGNMTGMNLTEHTITGMQ